jgi:hypothetical protein
MLVLALPAYVASLLCLSDMHGSDAAGNSMGQAFTLLLSIGLWVLLAVLLIVTAVKGGGPAWWNVAALVLFPVCAVANFVSISLLMDGFYTAKWPLAVPVLAPLLLTLVAMRPMTAPVVAWGALAALSLFPWPTYVYRALYGQRDRERAAAEQQASEPQRREQDRLRRLAAFEKLDDNSPVKSWLEFIHEDGELRARAFAGIRKSPRRQADIEQMMRDGFTYVVRDLPDFDLQATPPICEGTRRALREIVADMQPSLNSSGPIYLIADDRIQGYRRGIEWAVEHGCECGPELAAVEEAIRHFQDTEIRREVLGFLEKLQKRK